MTIDWWTLGFQLVNIVILVWLLGWFFWRPVAAMIDARRDAATRILTDAEAARREAEETRAEVDRTRAGLAAERDKILSAARSEAEGLRDKAMEDAQAEIAAEREHMRGKLAQERAAGERAWTNRAADLAVEMANRVLALHKLQATPTNFLDELVQGLGDLSQLDRQAAISPGAVLRLTSAVPLDAGERETCRKRIAQALGAGVNVEFDDEPDLIAGLELTGPGFAVRNSWRAALDRFRSELSHAERA